MKFSTVVTSFLLGVFLVVFGLARASDSPVGPVTIPSKAAIERQAKRAAALQSKIESAKELELFALNPIQKQNSEGKYLDDSDDHTIHGFEILGKAITLDQREILELSQALGTGIKNGGLGNRCFFPRHALRFKDQGITVSILICFECRRVELHEEGANKSREHFTVSDSSEKTFDAVFAEHRLPKAPSLSSALGKPTTPGAP